MKKFRDFVEQKEKGVDFSDPKVKAGLDKQDKENTARFEAEKTKDRQKFLDSIGKKK